MIPSRDFFTTTNTMRDFFTTTTNTMSFDFDAVSYSFRFCR